MQSQTTTKQKSPNNATQSDGVDSISVALSPMHEGDALLVRTAEMLQNYLKRLFKIDAALAPTPSPSTQHWIILRLSDKKESPSLSEQGYILRRHPVFADHLEIIGGSPVAVYWGAAELAEFWGVRFATTGDLFPDAPGSLRLPDQTIVREPVIPHRGVRLYNDWPNDTSQWAHGEYEVILDQLAKMRVNQVLMAIRPIDPFAHMQWRGSAKNVAATKYGFRLPLEPDMIGYDHFVKSGDAARGEFNNSDLDGHPTYEQTILAGDAYLTQVRKAAHKRGIQLAVSVTLTDFPEPVTRQLVKETGNAHVGANKTSNLTRIRYGQWVEGATPEIAAAMSIRNPHYLDLVRTALQTYVNAFDQCDAIYLWTSEFRNSEIDVDYAWNDLENRCRLSEIMPFDELIEQARSKAEINPDRAEHEVKADLCLLWLYDDLLNRHPVKTTSTSPRIVPSGLNADLNRYIPRVLPDCEEYLVNLGYMPTSIKRWEHTLKPTGDSSIRFSMVLTTEDDNVGPFPQYSLPSVAQSIKAATAHHVCGFFTRQWNYTKTLPALHHLTHASWQPDLEPADAMQHLFEPICGPAAMSPLSTALTCLQDLTTQMHTRLDCPTFLAPHLISGRWSGKDSAYFGQADNIRRLEKIHRELETAMGPLHDACQLSKPAGVELLNSMYEHARFGLKWIEALIAMANAKVAHKQGGQADQRGDIDQFDRYQQDVADYLKQASLHFEEATRAWSQCIDDRCDLGVLAVLHTYAIKTIRAITHLADLDAIHWSKTC